MTEMLLDINSANFSFALYMYGLRKMEEVNRVLPLSVITDAISCDIK